PVLSVWRKCSLQKDEQPHRVYVAREDKGSWLFLNHISKLEKRYGKVGVVPIVFLDENLGLSLASALVAADVLGTLLYKGDPQVSSIVKWVRKCRN
ncbi:hypothetical protein PMAYCL1PPCAC_21292, partial [Pristionchus mayeri]